MSAEAKAAIGARIRELRELREMSQETLAGLCYVTQPAVSHWERGIQMPARSVQHRLADIFHVSRSMLFREVVVVENGKVA